MFGFGHGLIPKTVDELKKAMAACKFPLRAYSA
jgi:hypothetical protein